MKTNNNNPGNNQHNGGDQRSDTRKHQYKDHDEVLTNDENYDADTKKFKGEEPDWDDKLTNEDENK